MTNLSRSCSPPTSLSPGDPLRDQADQGQADQGQADQVDEKPCDATRLSINLSGELCPFTFVRTKLALEELAIGAELRVIVDHEPAIRNIPRSATEWGQEVLGVTRLSAHTWAIDLRKRVR
jgi:tRNA 2-thiouridine synthesizing protein A